MQPSDTLRRADLLAYRGLAALGAVGTLVFGTIHRYAFPGAVDNLSARLVLAALCGIVVACTYLYPKRPLVYLIYTLFYLYTVWVLYLLAANRFYPDYAFGAMVVIAAASMGFLDRRALLWYLGFTLVGVVGVLAGAPPTGGTRVSGLVFFSYLLLFCMLAFVILRGRLLVQEKLLASRLRYALAAQGANDGLWDWDLQTERVYFSPRWREMLGLQDTGTGQPRDWFDLVHPEDLPTLQERLQAHLDGEDDHFSSEFRMRHRDGEDRWMLARGLAVRNEDGRATRIAGSMTDISGRKRAEAKLLHDAFHDSLTGLPNRALFLDRLSQTIRQSRRRRGKSFAVLFLDLDRFKLVNDSFGHAVGDQLLLATAARLQAVIRSEDTVARLAGDEFGVLVSDLSEASDVSRVIGRIQQELASPVDLGVRQLRIAASIGVVFGPGEYERPEDLVRDADIAMYRAKAQGSGTYAIFDPEMQARTLARLDMEADLREALTTGGFCLHYQPIISLDSQQLTGFEALVRWQHPTRGLLPPGTFIAAAEDMGLIVPLGAWILREACRQLGEWQRKHPHQQGLTVSVNVSGRQLSQPDFVAEVAEALHHAALEPSSLRLEITESVLLEDPDAAVDVLNALREVGVQLYLDDFGTGYSSFSYLHRFPIHAVKLDRSFVQNVEADSRNAAIVSTLILLAEQLGLGIVAEGVETEAELAHLRSIRCPLGQGFLFSRPLTAGDVELRLLGMGEAELPRPS